MKYPLKAKTLWCYGIRKGFSLIELMVVIGIIGVIMLMLIPSFGNMQNQARMRAGAQSVAQDFRQIRERSLARGGRFLVMKGDTNFKYIVINPNGDTTIYKLGGSFGGRLYFGAAAGVTPLPGGNGGSPANGFDFPSNTLIFFGRGDATNGVVYITNNRETYAVHVNPIGNVKVWRFVNGNWSY